MAAPTDSEKAGPKAGDGEIPLPVIAPEPRPYRNPRLRILGRVALAVALWFSFRTLVNLTPLPGQHNVLRHKDRGLSTKQVEKLFLSVPNPDSALAASRAYATHPHLAGSPEDFGDAKSILELFQSELGIEPPAVEPIFPAGSPESRNATLLLTARGANSSAWIDVYYPVLNAPLDRSLQILGEDGNAVWTADLEEDGDPLDEDAHKYRNSVPAWHGLSKDGEVEGQLVYANYGTKEDYDELVASGADLTGKIVITRYGHLFRGLKIKQAIDLGAVGVLIYSDPRDDGYVTVENGFSPYPAGPARNPTSVQRGSVVYLSFYPGDPTTPGYPAYEDAERTEGTSIPTIPSLPISWANAERLLEEISDLYVTGEDGQRRLSGKASSSTIKLVNHVDTKVTPIWNTMASIPGHVRNEVVVIGCHRDAWVLGAADPTSGTVSLREIVKGFGALLRKGWRPLRTILFASWDGEEYGLVGSTEYGEDFADWISEHAVAYLNVDVSADGSQWNVAGSPSLAHLIKQAALEVPHPTAPGKTLWDARSDQGPFANLQGSNATIDKEFLVAYQAGELEKQTSTGVSPLGSGSDYTVFLQRLGVASSDQGFGYTPTDAAYHYHSIYDTQRWQEVYGDPGFHRHVAVAKHLGLMALRLTESIILPLNTTHYALELDAYLDKVETAASSVKTPDLSVLRNAIKNVQAASFALDIEKRKAEKNLKKIFDKIFRKHNGYGKRRWLKSVKDWIKRVKDWIKRISGVQPLQFQYTHEDIDDVEAWARYLGLDEQTLNATLQAGFPIRKLIKAARRVRSVNLKIIAFERGFISEGGIKEREWYKHLGVAPGKWLGYGATTFPALTEALTVDKNATEAAWEAERLTTLLQKLAPQIQPSL